MDPAKDTYVIPGKTYDIASATPQTLLTLEGLEKILFPKEEGKREEEQQEENEEKGDGEEQQDSSDSLAPKVFFF